ncbi:MAG: hypothetical protein LBI33_08805 [Propionibacteriaceae bacterium]|jgi:hypothetical protein|nr:hypothetical protein [Propionibacteriaceae bacterium]
MSATQTDPADISDADGGSVTAPRETLDQMARRFTAWIDPDIVPLDSASDFYSQRASSIRLPVSSRPGDPR